MEHSQKEAVMDKEQKKSLAGAMLDVINAAHVVEGKPAIDEKQKPVWMDILANAPDYIFIHPERYWEIEQYVKEAIKQRAN